MAMAVTEAAANKAAVTGRRLATPCSTTGEQAPPGDPDVAWKGDSEPADGRSTTGRVRTGARPAALACRAAEAGEADATAGWGSCRGWTGSFLIQRLAAGNPTAPSGIAIFGPGETAETLGQHYYDSRGAARIYQMTLTDGVWKLWREASGFWQRYTGVFSDDGR
jgi:hypothetical protein